MVVECAVPARSFTGLGGGAPPKKMVVKAEEVGLRIVSKGGG